MLKLKATSAQTQDFAYLSHHDEGTLSSSLLWHARFGHINCDSLHMLNQNGVFWFAYQPRNLKKCDACILGKHSKQPFHNSTSKSCRNLELIHSNLCGPIPVISDFGNKYNITFINDYTMMCWVYLWKHKSQAFETFRNFHV